MRERLLVWLETFGDNIARHGWYDPSGMGVGPDPAILGRDDLDGDERPPDDHPDDLDPEPSPRPDLLGRADDLIGV